MNTFRDTAEVEYRQFRFQPPRGAADLLLVRHGESQPARPDEPFPLLDGRGDPGLAAEGEEHAERVATRLGKEHIDALYVTPLRRTAQTAAPLARALGLSPTVEPELTEVHLGEWEGGLLRKHVAQNHPLVLRIGAEQRWDVIPGAEASEDFRARLHAAVERIAGAHPDQRLAVFTHGGVIGMLLAMATGAEPFAFTGADNGSISELVVTGQQWIVRRFNDTAHLAG